MIADQRIGAAGALVADRWPGTGRAVIADDRSGVADSMVPNHWARFALPMVAHYRFDGLAMISHDGLAGSAVIADNRSRGAVVADDGPKGAWLGSGSARPTARANGHAARGRLAGPRAAAAVIANDDFARSHRLDHWILRCRFAMGRANRLARSLAAMSRMGRRRKGPNAEHQDRREFQDAFHRPPILSCQRAICFT